LFRLDTYKAKTTNTFVQFEEKHGLLLSTSPVYMTVFHRKSSCRLCFTWTCMPAGRQVDTRLMLWK